MSLLICLLLVLQGIILFNFKGNGIVVMLLLLVPTILTILQCHKICTHQCSIELQDGTIVCNLSGNTVKHIDISRIHGITANETAERFVDAQCLPRRPAVLIVADPENATITGPRKFTDAEADFILKILNQHRHNIRIES